MTDFLFILTNVVMPMFCVIDDVIFRLGDFPYLEILIFYVTVNNNAVLKYCFTVKNDITQLAICLESCTVLES